MHWHVQKLELTEGVVLYSRHFLCVVLLKATKLIVALV